MKGFFFSFSGGGVHGVHKASKPGQSLQMGGNGEKEKEKGNSCTISYLAGRAGLRKPFAVLYHP